MTHVPSERPPRGFVKSWMQFFCSWKSWNWKIKFVKSSEPYHSWFVKREKNPAWNRESLFFSSWIREIWELRVSWNVTITPLIWSLLRWDPSFQHRGDQEQKLFQIHLFFPTVGKQRTGLIFKFHWYGLVFFQIWELAWVIFFEIDQASLYFRFKKFQTPYFLAR